jgi:hypothetical protein
MAKNTVYKTVIETVEDDIDFKLIDGAMYIENDVPKITLTGAVKEFALANEEGYNYVTASDPVAVNSNVDTIISDMVLTPGKGSYTLTFNSQYELQSGNITAQGVIDLTTAYNTLLLVPVTDNTHTAAFGSGEVLTAGVYTITGAGTLAGNITLDAQGDPNAIFIFRFSAAFSAAANANVILFDGATACNVFWIAEGAISVGASPAVIKGNLISNNGAVDLGAGCSLVGKMFSRNGAIGLGVGCSITATTLCVYPDLGVLSTFAMFTSSGNVTDGGGSVINGNIGTNFGLASGFASSVVNGVIYLAGVTNNAIALFSIYQNGVIIPHSTRRRELSKNTVDIVLQAISTIEDGQNIDVRCSVDSGNIILRNRILILKK